MNLDQWSKILMLLVSLIQVIIWPLIILVILIYFRMPLKKFLEGILEINLKAGPIDTTFKRQQVIEVAASLGAATAAAQQQNEISGNAEFGSQGNTKDVARLVNQVLSSRDSRKLEGTLILWVDDIPSNNTYQRNALEALGIRFTIAASTEEAITVLQKGSRNFNAIISDMRRPNDPYAGYTLLDKIKAMNINSPFIIYSSGGNRPENKAEARSKGAFASVSGPQALFETVILAIESNS